jgi:TonB-linked SusC/RagA family outer membrane protein
VRKAIVLGAVSLIALLSIPDVSAAQAQGRTIGGVVTRAIGGRPIQGVTVTVTGSQLTAQSDEAGRYAILAPESDVRLSFRAIGFSRKDVLVPETQTNVDVALTEDVFELEAVVVTGQATTVERRNATTATAFVSGEDVTKVTAPTIESSLTGRVAGVNLQSNSGAPGGGIQMQIRGNNTILGAYDPLYVIDGVIYSNVRIAGGRGDIDDAAFLVAEDDPVNRVADINPSDVAGIEILKGAAATSIYGSKASNGVVVITTNRGQIGKPQVTLTSRLGSFSLANRLQSRRFTSVAEAKARYTDSIAQLAIDSIAAANSGQLPYNDLYDQVWHARSPSYELIGDVRGGSGNTRYYVSGTWKKDQGIEDNTGFGRQGLRVNVDQGLGSKVDVHVSSVFNRAFHSRGWDNNCNNYACGGYFLAYEPSFVDLRPRSDGTFHAPIHGLEQVANPIQTGTLAENHTETNRFTGGVTVDYAALSTENSNLKFVGAVGADIFQQQDNLWSPNELFYEQPQNLPGEAIQNNGVGRNLNWNLNGIFQRQFGPANTTTSAGLQFEERQLGTSRVRTQNLLPGQQNINQGTNTTVTENFTKERTIALYLNEQALLSRDRIIVTAGVRAERSSVNGDVNKYYIFPRFSGAYRFQGLIGEGSELKLRASYGETGNQPLFGQKFTLLDTPQLGGQKGFAVAGAAGSPKIEPERLREWEGGIDASFLNGRGTLEATYYHRHTTNLLLQRVPAPSSGFATQIFNGGEIQNKGFEVVAGYAPIQRGDLTLLLRSTFTSNRSKVLDLPVPGFRPPLSGFGGLGVTFIQEGQSLTQIKAFAYDAAGVRTPTIVKVGDSSPDYRIGFTSDLTWKSFSFGTVWDYQHGGDIINLTSFLYVDSQLSPDFGKPSYTKKLNAYNDGVMTPFIEDATFLKLREVSVGWLVPSRLTNAVGLGVRDVRLGISARNLKTWSNYSGLDPEVANLGDAAIRNNLDVAPYPPSRSFFFTLAVGF